MQCPLQNSNSAHTSVSSNHRQKKQRVKLLKKIDVLKLNFKSSLLSVNLIKMTMMIELLIYLGRVLFMGFSLATGQAMTRVWRCWWPNARSRWLDLPKCWPMGKKKLDSLKSWPIGKQEEEKLDLSKCWPIWNQPMCWPTIISPLLDNSWYLSWKKILKTPPPKIWLFEM